jgi:hypothetical protein
MEFGLLHPLLIVGSPWGVMPHHSEMASLCCSPDKFVGSWRLEWAHRRAMSLFGSSGRGGVVGWFHCGWAEVKHGETKVPTMK